MLSHAERTRYNSGLRMRWTPIQTFWKRIRSVSYGIAPSTLTAKLLTREKQVCEIARHFVRSRMPHRMRQQYFDNTVVNIAACQLQWWLLHLWMSMHYQGWLIPAYGFHFRHIDVSLDKANDIGDKDFLHKIRGSDNKCTDMVVPDYFQYHMVFVNSYLTRLVHSQKAYPSTHTS